MKILLANFTKMVADSGGLAKVTCLFAAAMLKRGHTVSLLHSDEAEGKFFYTPPGGLSCFNLNRRPDGTIVTFPHSMKVQREFMRLFSKRQATTVNSRFMEKYLTDNLRYYLDLIKPDVIVAFQPAANKLLLCDAGTKIPVVSMSHGDPEDYFHNYPIKETASLTKSAVCQVLLPSFEAHIKQRLPQVKTVAIGNAVPQYPFTADLAAVKKQYKIVSVGTLTKNHKRPHLLIQAFGKVAAKYPDWILEIWGGKDRAAYYKELELAIRSRNLGGRVFLKGVTNNVPDVLRNADIFAFPSAYEGFGLALAEGMSAGLPAVGFRNCTAVNEMIRDGETGFLCADGSDAFAAALDKLMADRDLRIAMGRAAKIAVARYAPDAVWADWEKLLRQTARQ